MNDKFGRELFVNDICFKLVNVQFGSPKIIVCKILDFTDFRVKIGTKRYVEPTKLIKASDENLEGYID